MRLNKKSHTVHAREYFCKIVKTNENGEHKLKNKQQTNVISSIGQKEE